MINPIQNYYRKLDDLRRIAGAENESSLRTAFQILLDTLGQEHGLILHNEYPFTASNGTQFRIDGALIDRIRLVHGYWEAKDEKDDLDKEIEIKLAKGYPKDNIIFEDTRTAVLLQNGQETMRCKVSNATQLQTLLESFFVYELPEVKNFRLAKAKFLSELPKVAAALTQLLNAARLVNERFRQHAEIFLQSCQSSIGKRVTAQHVDEMLIQHILTDEIFRAVFPHSRFHTNNHLAYAINNLVHQFLQGETQHNLLKRLEPYFAVIRQAAANTTNSAEKQDFLKQVYEDFYVAYNPKDADKLGVVYTPKEVVRFIIEGCDWLTQQHFYKRLADQGLDILDPCMGTGTFIVDLLEYWRGDHQALQYKFTNEVHANEISILPYYIAVLNIEQTYDEITSQWCEFSGACFVNTLDNWGFEQTHSGAQGELFGNITEENKARLTNQNSRKIPVIIGNPPYNANQQNANDDNPNDAAPIVDKRIKDTYLHASTAQKTKLYDPYIRFFRWASDRIGERGIIAFITNRSYLDSRQADGLRKTWVSEFQEIWIVDLMSDVRKNPKISGTKHNIFGIQTGVAIVFLVRIKKIVDRCIIHYFSLDDFLLASEKRRWLKDNKIFSLARAGKFRGITPNKLGIWLNQPIEYDDWNEWLPIASKEAKAGKIGEVIFKLYSLGVITARDEWVYGLTANEVRQKVKFFISHYEAKRINKEANDGGIKWSRAVKNDLKKNIKYKFDSRLIIDCLYRPFIKRKLYFSKQLNEMQSQLSNIVTLKNEANNSIISLTFHNQLYYPSIQVSRYLWDYGYGARDSIGLPFYIYNKDAQAGVEALNAAGRIKNFDGDYLHINEANFGGAKSNLFVKESVSQDYEIKSDGTIEKTITINYKNRHF